MKRTVAIVLSGALSGAFAALSGALLHPLAPFALLAAIPLGTVAVLQPQIGLLLTVVSIPLEGLGRFTSSSSTVIVSVAKLFGLATLLAWMAAVAIGRRRIVIPREMLPLSVFWIVGAVTLTYTTDPGNGAARAISFLSTILFFLVITNLVEGSRSLHNFVVGLLVATAAIGLFSIAIRFLPGFVTENTDDTVVDAIGSQADHSEDTTLGEEVLRSGGATGSPHVYAANLLVSVPLYLFLIVSKQSGRTVRLAAAAGLLIALANLILTGTRSAIVTCLPLMVLMVRRGLVRISLPGLLAVAALGAALLLALPGQVIERLFDEANYSVAGAATLSTRLHYWAAGLDMLHYNWLTGMGIGNFFDLARFEPSTTQGHAFMHNIYLQLFNEVGIVGFGAIVTFLVMTVVGLEVSQTRLRAAGRADTALLACAVECSVLSGIILGFTMDYLHFAVKDWWFMAGAAVVLRFDARSATVQDPA